MARWVTLVLGTSLFVSTVQASAPATEDNPPQVAKLRVATFNIEDVRTEDLRRADHPRLQALATIIQEVRPDILFLNEIAFDEGDGSDGGEVNHAASNGQRFADAYLATPQQEGLEGIRYRAFMAPVNTGHSSGFDLDHSGFARTVLPPRAKGDNGAALPAQTREAREYGNDCWGFGTFPGQYGMALLAREGLVILAGSARTFRQLRWRTMPDALVPRDPDTGKPWYSDEQWKQFPLSSKSHWDVPVELPGAAVLHLLCSHPTPPVFDGPEDRNGCRNHDEIRFWGEYLRGAEFIVDDQGLRGGLDRDALFVIVGDLNADPRKGDARGNPVGNYLLSHPRIQGDFVPKATVLGGDAESKLAPDDTAAWGLRVDYVLPSVGLRVLDGKTVRPRPGQAAPTDHFAVWLDLEIPRPAKSNRGQDRP